MEREEFDQAVEFLKPGDHVCIELHRTFFQDDPRVAGEFISGSKGQLGLKYPSKPLPYPPVPHTIFYDHDLIKSLEKVEDEEQ